MSVSVYERSGNGLCAYGRRRILGSYDEIFIKSKSPDKILIESKSYDGI